VNSLAAMQARAFDASMFIAFMQARLERRSAVETFLAERFRPEMKPAVEAWLKLDPLNNSAAPPSPFRMAEYAQVETAEAGRQEELSATREKTVPWKSWGHCLSGRQWGTARGDDRGGGGSWNFFTHARTARALRISLGG
jgi:hypothetical protein